MVLHKPEYVAMCTGAHEKEQSLNQNKLVFNGIQYWILCTLTAASAKVFEKFLRRIENKD